MSASIDFCTPGRWRAHKRFASEPPFGLISLHAGRLYSSRRDGRVEHDHDLADITVEPARDGATAFGIRTGDGQRWTLGFLGSREFDVIRDWDGWSNSFGIPVTDHDVGDRWQAQDVCAAWQRILADPTRPDPSAWHYTPPGDG